MPDCSIATQWRSLAAGTIPSLHKTESMSRRLHSEFVTAVEQVLAAECRSGQTGVQL